MNNGRIDTVRCGFGPIVEHFQFSGIKPGDRSRRQVGVQPLEAYDRHPNRLLQPLWPIDDGRGLFNANIRNRDSNGTIEYYNHYGRV